MKDQLKKWIDANVWDGEDRSGAKNDSACFNPDDLQELIDELYDYEIKPKYAAVCQELECATNDIELLNKEVAALKARISELESDYIIDPSKDDVRISGTLAKVKADAIREATFKLEFDYHVMVCSSSSLMEYADKLEAES